ncbi:alpha/beta hydrolase [Opitutus sp. ER46]|uniref:alpha/beta hydrolase n=1 Tax=Opitutus sp. ER46 TaxID=2161864 RepID=UPI000D30430D|nr:alpha/beta hydrolase [Opitutus sp. ER46]PTX94511.1 hypothetical protein DB354_12280 [Opitutus sp. ER46]
MNIVTFQVGRPAGTSARAESASGHGFARACQRTFVAALLLTALGASAAQVKRDVEYGRVDDERLLLDVHQPDGNGPFPVAILIHGGGWSGGDKSGSNKPGDGADITPWFALLLQAKYTLFSINYRLAPKHPWPACEEDVETAIRWVKAHASEYQGDPARIALFGHSAGGHLAMYAATRTDPRVQVQAVVGFAPVTDLVSDTERRGGLSTSLQKLFGLMQDLTPESRAVLRDVSPLQHVHAKMPPVLIVHGDADKTVPLSMSIAFIARLRTAGVRAELITRTGVPHSLVKGDEIDTSYRAPMLEWLQQTLVPKLSDAKLGPALR